MRPLRKTLKALSPAAILLPVLCGIIFGQSGLTTIQDTLFNADGARYNGTLFIKWSTFDAANPGTVIQQSKTVQVVNGNLLVQLAPNNSALPPANVYTVLYQSDGNQQYSETWTVPLSATPLKVPQVRTGGGAGGGGGGGGSAGGLTGTAESDVTNLVSDLNARPIKGPGFGTNAVAVIDGNGQIETVTGNLGDCVFVDGTTGPCTAGVVLPTFVNGETPVGLVDGLNPTFTLANSPSGSSLLLFRNGVLTQAGTDYTLTGSTIHFLTGAVPQPGDALVAQYRIDPGAPEDSFGVATGPSGAPGMNGCGAAGVSSKTAAYQIVPADNGYMIIQTANADFTLPVTPPVAGWCVALLDASGANLLIGNSGNNINGANAAYPLGAAAAVFVISDGSGYWVSAGKGGNGVVPSGNGTVKVTGGVASLVSGPPADCVQVSGSSISCGAPGGSNGQIQYNNAGEPAGFTPAVNGTGISTPSGLNFLNSAAFNGLQFTFSNPTAGNVQLGATGTLDNAGLTHSSFTPSLPSWLSGATPVALGGTFAVTPATGQASHQVIGTCGAATSFAPCSLVPADIPILNQNTTGSAANVTGIVTRANGGLNSATPGTGLLRDGVTPSAAELSGDAVTAGSNVVTVRGINGTALSGLATGLLKNTASTGIPSIAVPGADYAAANASVTVNGQTCSLGSGCNANSGAAAHGVAINEGNGAAIAGTAAGTAHQRLQSGGSGADPSYADDRDVKIVPFAAAPSGTAGGSVSFAASQWAVALRTGSNNIGATLQAMPSVGASLQFLIELPGDWDPASQPYIKVFYGSGANTAGTAIWTASSACSRQDGSVTDDPAFNAESAFATQTMTAADRMWAKGGQFTAMTSANNCLPGSSVIVRLSLSGTASSVINAYQAVITIPTLPVAAQVN